jgi:hypothetical protein
MPGRGRLSPVGVLLARITGLGTSRSVCLRELDPNQQRNEARLLV